MIVVVVEKLGPDMPVAAVRDGTDVVVLMDEDAIAPLSLQERAELCEVALDELMGPDRSLALPVSLFLVA